VRAESLHADVILVTSAIWQTTCTLIRGPSEGDGGEAFVVDSPVLPDELAMLPSILEQARFPFSGLLATHAHWDHLLGRLAFAGGALGVAERTAEQLHAHPGAAQRELRAFDERHYVHRPAPLSLGSVQPLPVPGRLDVGEHELEVHATAGHTAEGMAIAVPWAGVLIAGDYLSPVEIPTLEQGGTIAAYLDTLARLEPLVAHAQHVVPGHGPAMDRDTALRVLEEDRTYLQRLERDGEGAALPAGRRDAEQRRLHAANVARRAGR
jgi:glyoxylase-like metal-dependent hydrolase (beta-lactamase superfamily II)